jgi:radical SAM superfamily enzyme YgiQ (UPF0313 family)
MHVLLISTYELGRQPFGLASPAAWLRRAGFDVECADTTLHKLSETAVMCADVVAFYLPMHTATRISIPLISRVRELHPSVRLAAYGLYAPLNEPLLRSLGVEFIVGGEFEAAVVEFVRSVADGKRTVSSSSVRLDKLEFILPERASLPSLRQYARLVMPDGSERTCGYTEASRGCKHLCRHCPIVPVYKGKFRIVQQEIVLADIRQQVAAGAEHITFGDPDFFNGPAHALAIVRAMHRQFPHLSYDVTIKIEHLLKYADALPLLRETGCAFVTSAVESLDDHVLTLLAKDHTRADFLRVAQLFRNNCLTLAPTFVAFMPQTTLDSCLDLLDTVDALGLVEHVAPVQWSLRLLITSGSLLAELAEFRQHIRTFDNNALCYRWVHPDPRLDVLQRTIEQRVELMTAQKFGRRQIFEDIRSLALQAATGDFEVPLPDPPAIAARATIPYLTEPWYC